MDNFTAIAGCVDAGVKPIGTPQSGSITVFSGAQTVTGGNLTGDVTTSGGTATTLSDTGVAPGLYINPNITVDSKGRIIAATNGTGGSAGSGSTPDWMEITLANPGGETGTMDGWTMTGGGFTAAVAIASPTLHMMTPIAGTRAFLATANAGPRMSQAVDLSTFAAAIDAGTAFAMLEAYAADTYSTGEAPHLMIEFLNAGGSRIAIAITDDPFRGIGSGSWRHMSISARMPPLTRSMAVTLIANRVEGNNNNIAFDAVRAFVRMP